MKKLLSTRGVQIALGILWLIDGLFQLQPQMFTKNFASQVIAPAAAGQPFFISSVMNFSIQIISAHTIIFGILFAAVQLAIGVLILVKPTIKIGLILSILWGLFVWYFGEGAGGIFSGQTMLLMGAPGAALLYSLISLAVYPRKQKEGPPPKSLQPAAWLVIVWCVIWVGGAIYQLLPSQASVNAVGSMIIGNADGAPAWLSFIDTHVGSFVMNLGASTTTVHMTSMQMMGMSPQQDSGGYWFIFLLTMVQLAIGILILLPSRVRKIAIIAGIVLSVAFWIVGQNLGEYYSGLATDPSTGPLIILLGIAILANTRLDSIFAKFYKIIKDVSIGESEPEESKW